MGIVIDRRIPILKSASQLKKLDLLRNACNYIKDRANLERVATREFVKRNSGRHQ